MAKRKAAVSDIIYELDNDDITLSSDDEAKQPIINPKEVNSSSNAVQSDSTSQDSVAEIINIDSSLDISNCVELSPPITEIGGKSLDNLVASEDDPNKVSPECSSIEVISDKKRGTDGNQTTLYHEDIDIDSPGNSDLGVVGCENRTPLITVRFRDNKLAMAYKKKIKEFMLSLIKLHENEDLDLDNDTDLELDIWPEELVQADLVETENDDNGFFFVDTAPCDQREFIPAYNSLKDESLISNAIEQPVASPLPRRGPTCFNCDGDHALRECKHPKNYTRINEMRAKRMNKRTERYHMEDEQRFGHMVPGRISGRLRDALGLKRAELPMHIYRMRGIATLEPDEEEGEVCEPGSKDKFDIKKIWDFPGFNIPASKRYLDTSQESEDKEEVESIGDIPIPFSDLIVLDEEGEISEPASGRGSPSLDDLEVKKKLLLDALLSENVLGDIVEINDDTTNEVEKTDEKTEPKDIDIIKNTSNSNDQTETTANPAKSTDEVTNNAQETDANDTEPQEPSSNTETIEDSQLTLAPSSINTQTSDNMDTDTDQELKTPGPQLKTLRTDYGTPIVDSVSPYSKLPSDDKFAKDICDVLNFENLPNSIGKYKQISTLLKKVKGEVDRIQDS
ncbi:Zinc finger CCHC domain-containing protein 8 [Operophtera brumata]|uniref:Zinc finger CCHC domain-containing protein 8 n=1 Tax=Operophtera brumata TaxID=104452 RepID=A0A0L7LFB9_OPEBR|nr:Zinc finger CCHC domain-containing protein 8 [Operophtera brumata]